MQRLGAIFIAICMVMISASVGIILYAKLDLTIPEAAPISFGVLLALLLVHYQITRVRDKLAIDEQMDDLTRLKLALTKEVQDVREIARMMDEQVANHVQAEVDPILAELDVIGTLVKQLAETCADLDERAEQSDQTTKDLQQKLSQATKTVQQLEGLLRANYKAAAAKPAPSAKKNDTSQPGEAISQPSQQPKTDKEPVAEAAKSNEPEQGTAEAREAAPSPDEEKQERLTPEEIAQRIMPQRKTNFTEEQANKVRRALALNNLELYLQPVVTLPLRKPKFYEALSRLEAEDGEIITPDIFIPVCKQMGFMPLLDRLAINKAFSMMRRLTERGKAVDCFCNLSLESMADSDFFAHLRELFEQNRDLADHIILEFSQADARTFGVLEDETLQLLQSMGFRFSVDQITNMSADFDRLGRKGVRYAKLAAPILTHRDVGRGMDIHPADFSRVMARKGIELVVTHIESEATLINLLDFNIQYAQGDHFAPAKPLRQEAGKIASLSAAAAPTPTQSPAMRPQDVPAPMVHGLGRKGLAQAEQQARQVNSTPAAQATAPSRTLGENPKVAKALQTMAQQENGASDTRNHFRSVLAEAAGLMDGPSPAEMRAQNAMTQPRQNTRTHARPANAATQANATGHSLDRGQHIDFSENSPALPRGVASR